MLPLPSPSVCGTLARADKSPSPEQSKQYAGGTASGPADRTQSLPQSAVRPSRVPRDGVQVQDGTSFVQHLEHKQGCGLVVVLHFGTEIFKRTGANFGAGRRRGRMPFGQFGVVTLSF